MSDAILSKATSSGKNISTAKEAIFTCSGHVAQGQSASFSNVMASFDYEPQFVYIRFLGEQSFQNSSCADVVQDKAFPLAQGGSITYPIAGITPDKMTGSIEFKLQGKDLIGTAGWWRIGSGSAYKWDVSCNIKAFVFGAI